MKNLNLIALLMIVSTMAWAQSDRYIASSAIPKKGLEIKIFNNLYTEKTRNNSNEEFMKRSSFFTTTISPLYGITDRFNLGVDVRFRSVAFGDQNSSPTDVFKFEQSATARVGITQIGPRIRFVPFKSAPKLTFQSFLIFGIGEDLDGNADFNDDVPYIDWDGPTFSFDALYQHNFSKKWSLFGQGGIIWEDAGSVETNFNRVGLPITIIPSYFPNNKITIYGLFGYTQFAPKDGVYDYFAQIGPGFKYLVAPKLELETSYTYFISHNTVSTNSRAHTYNLGLRLLFNQ